MVMAANPAIQGDALARGLSDIFANTWDRQAALSREQMSPIMDFDIPTEHYEELFGYNETPPYPRRRDWGEPDHFGKYQVQTYTAVHHSWVSGVQWKDHHRKFNQLRSLENDAARAGKNYATLDERIFFQILTAGTDDDLLPFIPNAPDGAALFSATDGDGNNRFGVANGNAISPASGVGNADAVRNDFFDGVEQILSYQDPQGQPTVMFEEVQSKGFTVICANTNLHVFHKAFFQNPSIDVSGSSADVAVENSVKTVGFPINLISSPRITGNRFFVFVNGMEVKPISSGTFQSPEEGETIVTGDEARRIRDDHIEFIKWEAIKLFVVNQPIGTVQIN